MKELDLLLERFARGPLAQASAAERAGFEELLSLPDPLLADYLLGGMTPGRAPLARLVTRIRAYVA
jgi:succinate dehydrogenase flavin-adding protein (antitoxin of CptAB toxin-antitoxin module)